MSVHVSFQYTHTQWIPPVVVYNCLWFTEEDSRWIILCHNYHLQDKKKKKKKLMDVPHVCDAIDVSLLCIVYSTTHHILWLYKSKKMVRYVVIAEMLAAA